MAIETPPLSERASFPVPLGKRNNNLVLPPSAFVRWLKLPLCVTFLLSSAVS